MRVVGFLFILVIIPSIVYSQARAYEVHQRGMLHETIYNTGEIGRAMDGGQNGIPKGALLSMELPSFRRFSFHGALSTSKGM